MFENTTEYAGEAELVVSSIDVRLWHLVKCDQRHYRSEGYLKTIGQQTFRLYYEDYKSHHGHEAERNCLSTEQYLHTLAPITKARCVESVGPE
jgi:hypothetical protein